MAKWTLYHGIVFLLTFFGYAFFHTARKTFSNVKKSTSEEWTPAECVMKNDSISICIKPDLTWNDRQLFSSEEDARKFMGILDATFLFSYAAGLYVSGSIADRSDLRIMLSLGMCLTSITIFIFGPVFAWCHVYSKPAYLVVWILNGFLQSSGWPCVVAVMGNWFGIGSRGLILGLWSSCASVGNIIGAVLVSSVLEYGYEYSFLISAAALFTFSIVTFFGLVPSPVDVGMSIPDEEEAEETQEKSHHEKSKATQVAPYTNGSLSDTEYAIKNAYKMQEISASSENNLAKQGSVQEQKEFIKTPQADKGEGTELHTISKDTVVENGNTGMEVDTTKAPSTSDLENGNTGMETDTTKAPSTSDLENNKQITFDLENTKPKAISFWRALLLPGVIPYSLAYAFLKLVNYSFLFWLPLYLSLAYNWKESVADQLSTWYDVGGILGGTVAGLISDYLRKRVTVVVPMLTLGVPMLFIFGSVEVGHTMLNNSILLVVVGSLIGGVANLISAAISADLGRQGPVKGNSEALSTVTGIVDGTGSLGAAIGQVAVPYLEVAFGWKSVFYLFMVANCVTVLCIMPIFVREMKDIFSRCRSRDYNIKDVD